MRGPEAREYALRAGVRLRDVAAELRLSPNELSRLVSWRIVFDPAYAEEFRAAVQRVVARQLADRARVAVALQDPPDDAA